MGKPENYPDGDYDYEDVCQWQEQAIAEKDKLLAEKDALLEERAKAVDNCLIQIAELVDMLELCATCNMDDVLYEEATSLLNKYKKGD